MISNLETPSIWKLLALDDTELEQVDLVLANLAVARDVRALNDLNISCYCQIVNEWTAQFREWLPSVETFFRKSPTTWSNNIQFFRAGMLQHFLCHEIGVEYNPDERHATSVRYTNASDLFLNGVIDTKVGTCGNLAALHVAICRRMGWPVSLACVKNHQVSRFETESFAINIECTVKVAKGFSAGADDDYLKRFKLPSLAKKCGSDLRKLSMREMLGVFVGARARHYQDIGRSDLCDVECCLARTLLPTSRSVYSMAMMPFLRRGTRIFTSEEMQLPAGIPEDLAAGLMP